MTFRERLAGGIILFDGAMGTQIQALKPTEQEWDGKMGCSEVLNLTAPEKIQTIHENYLAAGSDVVETNTFGANEIVLGDYDMQDRVIEINRLAAQIARRAVRNYNQNTPRFIAGSMGPGTKLISLGQTDFTTMHRSYANQVRGLLEGEVDLLIIETCQDLLQIKTALLAAYDVFSETGVTLPVIVSVTIETTGTLLIGSEIGAVLATLDPFPVDVMGMNCATGPAFMRPYLKQICESFKGPVICQPNAGLPQNVNGEMVYTIRIDDFVDELSGFVSEEGVQIIGGCCGTNPSFIAALKKKIASLIIAERHPSADASVSSVFSAQTMRQDPAPFFIGERTNTNGSKQFREYLLKNDWDGAVSVAQQQQRTGAHGLDLCVAYTGRNEVEDMTTIVPRVARQVDLPLFVDTTDLMVMEAALKIYGGRAVINSMNLEDGEQRANAICRLARRYGAAIIALTIDELGMAMTLQRKIDVAKRLYTIAASHGLRAQDLIMDPLTFTLGSGDTSLNDSAIQTIEAIKSIKRALPGVFTNLGVSNVSFGLNPYTREILNSVFLAEAVKAGLDMAIVNVKKIIPLHRIDADGREMCLRLIYDRGGENFLLDFIRFFDQKAGITKSRAGEEVKLTLPERITQHIIQGNPTGMDSLLTEMLQIKKPLEIINELLIPAMKHVGDLFASGEMQLPFVLQSAEVMKFSVDRLEPFMEKKGKASQTSIVLATVRGDVHDIGKNLVDIILTNNGFRVYNLGIKCEIDTILQKAAEVNADAIGMSGLLVKSTVVMKENLEEMQHRGSKIPVMLGGAALTRSYVDDVCQPIYESYVVYCKDAFEGLRTMESIRDGHLSDYVLRQRNEKNVASRRQAVREKSAVQTEEISVEIDIPRPPFWGDRIVADIDLDHVFDHLTESVLFRGRWGYRRGKMSKTEFEEQLSNVVRPQLNRWKQTIREQNLFDPKIVYGYYPCNSEGEQVIVYDPSGLAELVRFNFPRQKISPYRCIADFFLPTSSGRNDIIAFQVATVGERASAESQRLFASDEYKKYLMFHGLSVESAEALAEYWHRVIREELGFSSEDVAGIEDFIVQKYRGSRYSFGYPACPDLSENRKIFMLLKPERIGVAITDEDQMVPEQTTSAFVVHHPQAKYFTIE
ncbi:methionine synthase [candidate division KSB1 bacterium]|nr:methionine synthase [candidate division KSB1 bacterium]